MLTIGARPGPITSSSACTGSGAKELEPGDRFG